MYNLYPSYNPYISSYSPYYSNNTYNPYDYYRNPDGPYCPTDGSPCVTQCPTWEDFKFQWVRVHHKDLGRILLQVVDTSKCTGLDPNKDSIGVNFFYPGSCEMEFSPDFSPLDLSAPIKYNGSIPPKHCRW